MKKLLFFVTCLLILMYICSFSVFADENYSEFSGGDGTPENPYIVSNAAQLNNVRNHLSAYFIQSNDIDMSDETSSGGMFYNDGMGWLPIGCDYNLYTSAYNIFSGNYDGNKCIIKGIKMNLNINDNVYAGLFGYNSGVIKNVGIEQCDYSATALNNSYSGGIVGYNCGTVSDCYNTGLVFATTSSVSRNYKGNSFSGGIVGYNEGIVKDCSNTGNISADVFCEIGLNASQRGIPYNGGIVGYNGDGSVVNCHNSGSYSGISGYNAAKIDNCYNSGFSKGGSIAGTNASTGTISFCYNEGAIDGYTVGGLVNDNYGLIENSFNAAKADATNTGGIVGTNNGSVYNCYNKGVLKSNATNPNGGGYIGGIAFKNYGEIKNSYNTANLIINAKAELGEYTIAYILYAGGITGVNYNTIENCYNTGSINATSYAFKDSASKNLVGGISGKNSSYCNISNCYNVGNMYSTVEYTTHTNNVGGIAGYSYSEDNISNCYWKIGSCQSGVGYGCDMTISKTSSKMKSQEFLEVLNSFSSQNNIWQIDSLSTQNNGYPMLNYENGIFSNTKEGTYSEYQYVKLYSFNDEPYDIYYTIDGSQPTVSSSRYENQIEIKKSTTIKAVLVSDNNVSQTYILNYIISPKVTANKKSGYYTTELDVTLTSSVPDCKIYYTLDGTTPTKYGTIFAGTMLYKNAIHISKSTDINAIAVCGDEAGEITHYYYTLMLNSTITYSANGGEDAPAEQTKIYDVNLKLSTAIPTRHGYTFCGWSENSNATMSTWAAGDTFAENRDATLYAVWEPVPYTESTISKTKNGCNANINLYNISESYKIIVTGYRNEKFVIMKMIDYTKDIETADLTGDIDNVKVMVWSSLSSLKPLTDVEEIPSSQWITE